MFKKEDIKIGVAPIAWTNDDLPELGGETPFETCISEMAEAGYEGCEVGNKYPKDPKVLKEVLAEKGLQVCNAWLSTFFTEGKIQETIDDFIKHRDFLYELGAKVIGVCEQGKSIQGLDKKLFKDKPYFTEQEWSWLFEGMNKIAELAEEKGMKVCFHEHNGTGVQTNEETIKLMENTNDNVYLLLDTGHVFYSEGTQEALEFLTKKYAKRIVHVHLKDVDMKVRQEVIDNELSFLDGVKKNMFVVPGKGSIDFEPIFKILSEAGYKGWFLVEAEGDPSINNPLENAKFARQFIKEKIGL
ncbi:inosose dehydratase [Spiroplasma chinense]|uniref:Inosose dehydratase n=1 Tax=Spiroplasma chinense TaxID=216932 RepID=A0A5B9Y561_9MOLU|nr:myo-inosose-2 dehydratase [Spiroplasma chinense]QEH61846.1 inosose dehydratase [Spiroplasma chinense]